MAANHGRLLIQTTALSLLFAHLGRRLPSHPQCMVSQPNPGDTNGPLWSFFLLRPHPLHCGTGLSQGLYPEWKSLSGWAPATYDIVWGSIGALVSSVLPHPLTAVAYGYTARGI